MTKRKKQTKKPKPKPRITSVSQWVSARISIELVRRLDDYAKLESDRTGYRISRSKARKAAEGKSRSARR